MDKLDPSHEIDEPEGLKPENELPQPEGLDPENELSSGSESGVRGSENQRIGGSEKPDNSENSEKSEKSETHSLAETRAAREEKEASLQGPHPNPLPEGEGIKDSETDSGSRMEKIEEDYKKNAETSGSGSSKMKLILAGVFAIVASLAVLFYFFSDEIFKEDVSVVPVPTAIPTVTMVPVENLDTQVTFVIPEGWKQDPQMDQFDVNRIRISSPDFKFSSGLGIDSGVQISLFKSANTLGNTLEQEKTNYQETAGQSNFSSTKVGALPALTWHNSYETNSDEYLILNGNDKWQISVSYPTWDQQLAATTKAKYQSSISSFINSIQFAGDTQVACTMDAKLCPDGSSVGRVAPNCEFAPCPGN